MKWELSADCRRRRRRTEEEEEEKVEDEVAVQEITPVGSKSFEITLCIRAKKGKKNTNTMNDFTPTS